MAANFMDPGWSAGTPTARRIDPRTGGFVADYSKPFSGTLAQPGMPGGRPGGTWQPGGQGVGGQGGGAAFGSPWNVSGAGAPGQQGQQFGGGQQQFNGQAPFGAVGLNQLQSLLPANATPEDIQGMNAAGLAFQEYERIPGLYGGQLAGGVNDQIMAQLSGESAPFTPGTIGRMQAQIGSQAGAADAARRRMIGDAGVSRGITGGAQLGMNLQSQEQAAQQMGRETNQLGIDSALANFQAIERGGDRGIASLASQAGAMNPSIMAKGQALAGFQNFGQGDPGLFGGAGFGTSRGASQGDAFGAQLSGLSGGAMGALGGRGGGMTAPQQPRPTTPDDYMRQAMERLAALGMGGGGGKAEQATPTEQAEPFSMVGAPGSYGGGVAPQQQPAQATQGWAANQYLNPGFGGAMPTSPDTGGGGFSMVQAPGSFPPLTPEQIQAMAQAQQAYGGSNSFWNTWQ